jgi:hypothetical protein
MFLPGRSGAFASDRFFHHGKLIWIYYRSSTAAMWRVRECLFLADGGRSPAGDLDATLLTLKPKI